MTLKRIVLWSATFFLAANCLSGCLAGKFMSNYALTPERNIAADIERTRHKADSLMPGSTAWYDGLKAEGILKDTTIMGYRGYRVHACYVPAKEPATAQGTAIVVHGYRDSHLVFLYLVRMYRDELNYNVLFPDLQYHGYSEGDHIQMGWNDRIDIENWIGVAHDIFRDDFMVLHGVSMGGATVMMTSGDVMPDYVRCFVEDCGYASVALQFDNNRKQNFSFIPADVLQSASLVTRQKYDWGFWEASSMAQLEKCDRPMLFIHGTADDFVPLEHVYLNYEAKKQGYKELYLVEGAIHANSYAKDPANYIWRVKYFLDRVKSGEIK